VSGCNYCILLRSIFTILTGPFCILILEHRFSDTCVGSLSFHQQIYPCIFFLSQVFDSCLLSLSFYQIFCLSFLFILRLFCLSLICVFIIRLFILLRNLFQVSRATVSSFSIIFSFTIQVDFLIWAFIFWLLLFRFHFLIFHLFLRY